MSKVFRIGKTGECPFCHKQFKQLHRHLSTGTQCGKQLEKKGYGFIDEPQTASTTRR